MLKQTFVITSLMFFISACGGGDENTPSSPPDAPDSGTPNSNLITECENIGCTVDGDINTKTLTITNAPITLTENGKIILE